MKSSSKSSAGPSFSAPFGMVSSDSVNSILSGHWRKFAEETGVSVAALRTRIMHLCAATMTQTCESLAVPHECEPVLNIVKTRAQKIRNAIG